jgi:hypothetical protein
MKIAIIGSSGFIGTELKSVLESHDLTLIRGRDVLSTDSKVLADKLEGQHVLINLSGKSVFGYWTQKRKSQIRSSRVDLTQRIVESLSHCKNPPEHFISASAIGIYESEREVNEHSEEYAGNFLSRVVQDWENEALKARELVSTLSIIRIGVVLGKGGGMYKLMRKLVRFNLGAYFGEGDQSLSFIYINDLVKSIHFIIENKIDGVINLTAPEYTDYRTFMKTIRKNVGALLIWRIPSFLIKTLLGELHVVALEGQKVQPEVLLKNSFNFEGGNIQDCITKIERN